MRLSPWPVLLFSQEEVVEKRTGLSWKKQSEAAENEKKEKKAFLSCELENHERRGRRTKRSVAQGKLRNAKPVQRIWKSENGRRNQCKPQISLFSLSAL
jgi:hypothetical protein